MADDTERQRLLEDRAEFAPTMWLASHYREDVLWLLERCRLLEAERNTAIQQGREQAADAVLRFPQRPTHAGDTYADGWNDALRVAAIQARGLPVPETNQEHG